MVELTMGRHPPTGHIDKLEAYIDRTTAAHILAASEFQIFNPQSIVQRSGEEASDFFLIIRGGVKLIQDLKSSNNSKVPNKKSILDIAGPGEIIGIPLILSESSNATFPVEIVTLAESEVLRISKKKYHSDLKNRPEFMKFAGLQIQTRITRLQKSFLTKSWSVEARIADFIIERLAKYPHLKMTRAEIAQATSTTPETAIRILSLWEKKGLFSMKSPSHSKPNLTALNEIITLSQS